jgi:sialic acid synthase SpsE
MKAEHTAVHCRIPNATYDRANELIGVTQKSMANLVNNAIITYVDMVVSNSTKTAEQYKPLKLDQYAYSLYEQDRTNSPSG